LTGGRDFGRIQFTFFQPERQNMTEADLDRLIQEYRNGIRELFDKDSPRVVGNSSPRHAAVLIEEIAAHAEKTFVAFAERMNTAVWTPAVMAALAKAVARGVDVRLLVERECAPIKDGSMPESVRKCVRRLGGESVGNPLNVPHCASGDGKSLRVETDPKDKSAVFSANNPEMASKIGAVFDILYKEGVALDAA